MNYNPGIKYNNFKSTKLKLYSTLSRQTAINKAKSSSRRNATSSLNKSNNSSKTNLSNFNFSKNIHTSNICLINPLRSMRDNSKPKHNYKPKHKLNQTYMSTISYLNVSKKAKPNNFKLHSNKDNSNNNNNNTTINNNNNTKHNKTITSNTKNKSHRPIKLTFNAFKPLKCKNNNNKSVNKSTNSNNVDKKKSVSKQKKNKCNNNNNHKEIKVKYCDINISADNMEKNIDKQIMLMFDKKSKNFNNNHNNTNNNIHNNHETNTITYNNFTLPSNTHEEILETSELINKYIRDCMESEVKSNQGELSLDDVKDIIKCFSFKNIHRTKSKTIFTEEINNTYYNGVYKQYNNYFF